MILSTKWIITVYNSNIYQHCRYGSFLCIGQNHRTPDRSCALGILIFARSSWNTFCSSHLFTNYISSDFQVPEFQEFGVTSFQPWLQIPTQVGSSPSLPGFDELASCMSQARKEVPSLGLQLEKCTDRMGITLRNSCECCCNHGKI